MIELLPGIEGVVNIPIDSIVTLWEAGFPGSEVLRDNRSLNSTHVRRLTKSHGQWPPILLCHFKNNEHVTNNYQPFDGYAIVDGMHRTAAAMKLGYHVVRANVGTYRSPADVVHAAILANSNHGIASSPGLRMAHALWLYKMGAGTIEDIASIAGVTPSGLKQAIRRKEQVKEELETEEEVVPLSPQASFSLSLYNSIDALREKAERDGLFNDGDGDVQQVTNTLRRIVANIPIKERGYMSTFIVTITRILLSVSNS